MFISQGIKDIAKKMIDNPNDWIQTNYRFVNKTNRDISFWTANGVLFIQLDGNSTIGLFEKILISRSIKQSIANKLNPPHNLI